MITISGDGIEVTAPTISKAAVLFERKKKFLRDVFWWINSDHQDVLLMLDRLSTPSWLAMALGRTTDQVCHILAQLKTKGLVDQFDGFWHRTAYGNEITLATDQNCGYIVARYGNAPRT